MTKTSEPARGADQTSEAGPVARTDRADPRSSLGNQRLLARHARSTEAGARRRLEREANAQGPVLERIAAPALRSPPASDGRLDPVARGVFENALGRDLGGLRIRESAVDRSGVERAGARAATLGTEVLLGGGPARERSFAHELVHVAQQGGAPVLDRAPPVRVRETAPPTLLFDDPEPREILDWTGLDLPPVEDALPWAFGNERLVALPAEPVLYGPVPADAPESAMLTRVPGPVEIRAPAVPASRMPGAHLVGVPAIGKEGMVLVRLQNGTGMLLDAGGARYVVPLRVVARLADQMGVSRVEWLGLTHTHADHVRNVVQFIRTYGIRAENFVLSSAWVSGTTGPLARVIRELRTEAFESLGYGPRWTPGMAVARSGIVETSVAAGGTDIGILASGTAQGRYEAAHTGGRARPSSESGDAAGFVYFFGRGAGRQADVSDVRGRDIARIAEEMEARRPGSFNAQFTGVRVLHGFHHHLGAVEPGTRDFEGIERLIRATAGQNGELTVVVQTRAGFRNERLLEYLYENGIRVVSLLAPREGDRPSEAMVGTRGDVTARGRSAEDRAGLRSVVQARRRLADLRTALEIAETEPNAIEFLGPRSAEGDVRSALRTRIERIERLLEELLGSTRTILGGSSSARAREAIRADLNRAEGVDSVFAAANSRLLRNVRRFGSSYIEELEYFRRTGRARPALYEYMRAIEPEIARVLQVDAEGREVRRYSEVEGRGRVEHGAPLAPRAPPLRMRGAALLMAGVEVVNATGPLYADYRANRLRVQLADNLARIQWWLRRGVTPYAGAAVDPVFSEARILTGRRVTDQNDVYARIERTIWEHAPSDARGEESSLRTAVRTAGAVDAFWVEEVPEGAFELFDLWLQAHVMNYDDYARSFVDVAVPAVRKIGSNFTTARWEYHTGRFNTSGWNTFEDVWRPSARLTEIMRGTARRVIDTTARELRDYEERAARPRAERAAAEERTPAVSAARTSGREIRIPTPWPWVIRAAGPQHHFPWSAYPLLRRARFNPGATHEAFSALDETHRMMGPEDFWNDSPEFWVLDDRVDGVRTAPEGYVLVAGADYNTHGAIRNATTRMYDPEEIVLINPPTGILGTIDSRNLTAEEERLFRAALPDRSAPYELRRSLDRSWSHYILQWRRSPNERGLALLRAGAIPERDR